MFLTQICNAAADEAVDQRIDLGRTRLNALTDLTHSMLGLLDKLHDSKRIESAQRIVQILNSVEIKKRSQYLLAKHPAGVSSEIDDVNAKTTQLEKETYDAGQDILQNEGRQKEALLNAYDVYNALGYFLYVLGWGLGLVASLYGINGSNGTD